MHVRILLFLLSFAATSLALHAQVPGDDQADTVYADTTYYAEDSSYYEPPDGYDDIDVNVDMPGDVRTDATSFAAGGGFYVGPTFEVTTLSPAKLDSELDGELVLYGVQVNAIISGWVVGANWTSATLYDMSTNYDEFVFGYGGFVTGYELDIVKRLSFRIGTLIGTGDLKMIKKRPDLDAIDSSAGEILERYRLESFFMLRPGVSIGYAPLPFLDLRIAADYLYPIGGRRVHDLKALTYGLHVMIGIGK